MHSKAVVQCGISFTKKESVSGSTMHCEILSIVVVAYIQSGVQCGDVRVKVK